MFAISFSNRFEVLLAQLLARLDAESPGPFTAQQVIVPSTAVRRAVELALARHRGICANVSFSFLAQWLWARVGEVVEVPRESPFTPSRLCWTIHALLGERTLLDAHPRLGGYLAGNDELARYELALRIARLYDQYISYRPDWLETWAAGGQVLRELPEGHQRADERWQAALWCAVLQHLGLTRQHPFDLFLQHMRSHPGATPAQAAHLFCLPGLPPRHLAMLRELGGVMELQAYVLNPCREYWTDIPDPRRASPEERGLGHPLLAAWGKHTKAHIERLFDEGSELVERDSVFAPHPGEHLLARLHNAILDLQAFAPGSVPLDEADHSIEVHICHGLTRELEVLHDRLLSLFAADPTLRPEDVLVALPDLVNAAPLIDGVFGTVPSERRIPYVITGRPAAQVNAVAKVLLALLELLGGRYPASAVFALLQQEAVMQRLDLAENDLACIQAWFQASGMYWGLDREQRHREESPGGGAFTLEEGLQRLALAYLLGDEGGMHGGLAAAGHVAGGETQALGRLWRVLTLLQEADRIAAHARPVEVWRQLFHDLLAALIPETAEWVTATQGTRATLDALLGHIAAGFGSDHLPLTVIRAAVQAEFNDPAKGGIPTGAVTFSALPSLRTLPYRVVCLLHLNHGSFPLSPRPDEFDLLPCQPRKGDRQRREDDRNLFLDLLLAAHDRLVLSYSGHNRRDNGAEAASVLVDELLEHLARATAEDPDTPASLAAARRRLCVEHPLQPFSPRLFDPASTLAERSYDRDYCDALTRRSGRDTGLPALFPVALAAPPDALRTLSPATLEQFFRNPCRALLQRVGIALPDEDPTLADDEPFLPAYAAPTQLAERLLPALLHGIDLATTQRLARAGPEFPRGGLGDTLLDTELQTLRSFAARLAPALAPAQRPAAQLMYAFEIARETWHITGHIGPLREDGLLRQRYTNRAAGDLIGAWVQHLLLNLAAPAGIIAQTRLFCRDGAWRLRPLESPQAAQARLRELLTWYRTGLMRPLHFFPRSALSYVEGGESLSKALGRWQSSQDPRWGESQHPAFQLALRGQRDVLDEEFCALAIGFFRPLLAHLEELS